MDEANGRKVCQLIAGIVIADEDLDPAEDAFIDKLLAKFGLDPSERDAIFPLVDGDEAGTALREMPSETREEAFSLLVEAAAADGKIVEEEREYLAQVANAIGVPRQELESRLKEALG